jgi:hypothetical protein
MIAAAQAAMVLQARRMLPAIHGSCLRYDSPCAQN